MRLGAAVIALAIMLASASASAEPTAEQLYASGQVAYDSRDYRTAIADWTRSYALSREPLLLYNIAQAHRLGGDCKDALDLYQQYVVLDPAGEQRPRADDFIRELVPKCGAPRGPAQAKQQEPTPIQIDQPASKSNGRLKLIGLATGGVGALSIAIGLGLGVRASSLGDEVTQACSVSCDWAEYKSKDARGRRYATIGYALDAVGLVAIAGGAVMYYLGSREVAVSVSPQNGDGGVVISWSGSW